MVEVEDAEDGKEVVISDALATHDAQGVRVDDLLAEGACAEVGSLGDVEDLGEWWFADGAAVHRPQTSEDAEERGFATAVRPDHENVLSGFHRE